MQPIYKIIDEELNQRIESELGHINNYMKLSLAKAKELVPDVENIAITKCGITGKHTILGVILKEGADTSMFKTYGKSGDGSMIYTIKRNTKKGKELAKELSFIGKSELLFSERQFEEELGYNPEQREIFDGGYMILNYLRFGHAKVDGKMVFVFRGYTGYKPTDKAQEMTISEYNEMFGKKR